MYRIVQMSELSVCMDVGAGAVPGDGSFSADCRMDFRQSPPLRGACR